jgi:glutamate synthase domain-containing protein 2
MLPFKVEKDNPNYKNPYFVPCAKLMGGYHKRRRPYRPASVINVSAMSFGSLSARAVESLNKGCAMAYCFHNTGEGGLSPYHKTGADVVFHFGTGYFGVRDENGEFSMEKIVKLVNDNPQVRAIEVKLSQGA